MITKKQITISVLFWIAALVFFVIFHIWGASLIDAMFHNRSYSFLNQLIHHRDSQPLSAYIQKVNHYATIITISLLLLSFVPYLWEMSIRARRYMLKSEAKFAQPVIFVTFLLIALLFRTPFFFQSVIDWDESTFILMGQSVLDGHLPYIELWDVKPPLAFVPFAVFIWLFGHSVVGIRIAGTIYLAGVAFLTHRTAENLWGRLAGLFSGILTIAFISLVTGGQAVMTEILTLLPLQGALFIAVKQRKMPNAFFFIGFLISIATLIRLNLAYLVVTIGLFILLHGILMERRLPLKKLFLYVIGGLIPLALVCLPYIFSGHLDILYASAVLAPLQYSQSWNSATDSLLFHLGTGFGAGNVLLWGGLVAGVVMCIHNRGRCYEINRQGILMIMVFFIGTALSIINNGAAFYQHFILIIGLLSLPAGFFYSSLFGHRFKKAIALIFAVCLVISSYSNLREYKQLALQILFDAPLMSDEGYRLAAYLREVNKEHKPIYLMEYNIAYWLTGTKPITKIVTHPDNIGRPYLIKAVEGPDASAETELKKIFNQNPLFVVKKDSEPYLKDDTNAEAFLNDTLGKDYETIKNIGSLLVYKRKSDT